MDSGKDKTSLKGSQTNVAESAQPLLETGPAVAASKERIDLESTVGRVPSAEPEERPLRTLSCIDSFTMNMNLLDRDCMHINDHINVSFEEVLAEPRVSQSFEQPWRLAYVLFAGTKLWAYRVLAAACALPCGLLWGLVFSLLALANVWLIVPALKVLEILLHVVRRVWGGTVRAILEPVFQSAALLRQGNQPPTIQESV